MNMPEKSRPDIMLIYPTLSVKERYGKRDVGNAGGELPPLGILSIAACLRESGYRVCVIDALVKDWGSREIVEYVRTKKPRVIGFSAITPNFFRAVDYANRVKEAFPDILTIIGGHHATILVKEVIKENKAFDIAVFGEGELTAVELMNAYKLNNYDHTAFLNNHGALEKIKGIAFRRDGAIEVSSPRELVDDLDQLPFPARDLVPMEKYIPLPNQYKRLPVAHMAVIRGCPYQCFFCSNNSVFGRKIRARSPRKVIAEIRFLMDKYKIREISFWDDMMTTNKIWINEFCDLLSKNRMDITWTCYARADSVSESLLRKMARAGCWNIFFGFESGNQKLLDNIGKGITLQEMRNVNKWCKKAGKEVRASFMLALPGETPELAQETINFAKELSPEYAQFCITTPYPGTRLFDEAGRWGRLSKDFSRYNIWEPVFVPFGYKNKEEILKMEKRANLQFYFRARSIFNLVKNINSLEDIKRYLKGFRVLLGFVR